MSTALARLSTAALAQLAAVLESGALRAPFGRAAIARAVDQSEIDAALGLLDDLARRGLDAAQAGHVLRLLVQERQTTQRVAERLELVWTGPDAPGPVSRDTSVVVRDLLASATRSVLVATFAVHQGRDVFAPLARVLTERPALRVRLVLNIPRPYLDERSDDALVTAAVRRLFEDEWPGAGRPEVYYDPRALSREARERASQHAKCVVVDERVALVTSANFTEAAQERNLEAGVLLADAAFARRLEGHFDALIVAGLLRPALVS